MQQLSKKIYNTPILHICHVVHRGEIVEKIALGLIPNKSELARVMDMDRTTLYRHFADANLDYGIILKYGKTLKHDFSVEFPELSAFGVSLREPLAEYKAMTLSDALKEADMWKAKYIDLLEKHTALLRRMVPRGDHEL